jgi:hypothetical protein
MKRCHKCDRLLPLEDFNRANGPKAALDGRRGSCKDCDHKRQKQWRLTHPEEYREKGRKAWLRIKAANPLIGTRDTKFKKGGLSVRLGLKHSEEALRKMSASHKAQIALKPIPKEHLAAMRAARKAKGTFRHTEETKEKFRAIARARKPIRPKGTWKMTEEQKEKMRQVALRRPPMTLETRLKMSASMRANREKHKNWKGGITKQNAILRGRFEYREWRKSVFERDHYTCVHCGAHGCYLHADHIKPFAYFPELRYEINNGRTLCVPCHEKTDTFRTGAQKKYAKAS